MGAKFTFFSLIATATIASATIDLTGSSGWVGIINDVATDQQTGQGEGDIIGSGSQSAFYKAYDDGGTTSDLSDDYIAFRIRVAADSDSSGWNTYGLVGLDIYGDGDIDIFVSVSNNGDIEFLNPGTGANDSPSTTSANYYSTYMYGTDANISTYFLFEAVTSTNDAAVSSGGTTDLGGDKVSTDYFFSYQVSVSSLITALEGITYANTGVTETITENTSISFIAATSNQGNAFNQDLAGSDGDVYEYEKNNNASADYSWATLGAASEIYTAAGTTPVPEPAAYALFFGFGSLAFVINRRKNLRS